MSAGFFCKIRNDFRFLAGRFADFVLGHPGYAFPIAIRAIGNPQEIESHFESYKRIALDVESLVTSNCWVGGEFGLVLVFSNVLLNF